MGSGPDPGCTGFDARLFLTPEAGLPAESPWLSPAALEFARPCSPRYPPAVVGGPLIASQAATPVARPGPVRRSLPWLLAHAGGDDPRLIYAPTRGAWPLGDGPGKRPWSVIAVGSPPKPPSAQGAAELLGHGRRQEANQRLPGAFASTARAAASASSQGPLWDRWQRQRLRACAQAGPGFSMGGALSERGLALW